MKRYLFKDDHNGHYISYHPFDVGESLSQEKVNKLILSVFPIAPRLGSHLDHLLEALDKQNIKFKRYVSRYYKTDEYQERFHESLDPLPDCMYKWDVLECISGNY